MRVLKEKLTKHIKYNYILYIVIIMSFMIGIASGAFTVNNLSEVQKDEISNYISKFYQIASSTSINSMQIFRQSILNNFETVFILWLLGATIVGIPFIFLVIGMRGFILGFSVGILINELKLKGIIFTFLAILPQNIFILLGILFIAVTSINFSLYILKNRKFSINELFSQFISYTFIVYAGFLAVIIGCLIESYVSPYILLLQVFTR